MNIPVTLAIPAILAGIAFSGYAQEMTIHELKAQGATTVSKDELGPLVRGATLRFTSAAGFPTQLQFNEDGSFYGSVTNTTRAATAMLRGTWHIDNKGRLCRAQFFKGQTDHFCLVLSRLGDKFYVALGSGRWGEVKIDT
jgi:hypothetical protein